MSTTWDVLAPAISGILGSGVTAWLAQRVIDHGLARALADRRASFEGSLEDKRQAFGRELEQQRQAAQQALEGFKAQLTLDAEVRRQVAAKKVEAILRFIDLANSLVEKGLAPVLKPFGSSPNDFHETAEAVRAYRDAFREAEAFFGARTRREIESFRAEVEGARDEYMKSRNEGAHMSTTDARTRADAARERFFEILRRELGTEPTEKTEARS